VVAVISNHVQTDDPD